MIENLKKRIEEESSLKTKVIFFGNLIGLLIVSFFIIWFWPANPVEKEYGVTFSAKYAKELELDPFETYEAILNDLGSENVRLVAYWDEIEKTKDSYDFSSLDWQIALSERYGVDVILSIGRRVPRWPECHIPHWANKLDWESQKKEIEEYLEVVVKRYKDSDVIKYWQVENEPFLTSYVQEYCGSQTDIEFLEKEIALVKDLDPETPVMTTDSGELGFWGAAYKRGDVFGSTFYIYLANNLVDDFKMPLNHNFYNIKRDIVRKLYGEKETFLIEISIEPWLTKPIIKTPIDEQLRKMGIDRVKEMVRLSGNTDFSNQYFWGPEWWYYLKKNGVDSHWEYFKELF